MKENRWKAAEECEKYQNRWKRANATMSSGKAKPKCLTRSESNVSHSLFIRFRFFSFWLSKKWNKFSQHIFRLSVVSFCCFFHSFRSFGFDFSLDLCVLMCTHIFGTSSLNFFMHTINILWKFGLPLPLNIANVNSLLIQMISNSRAVNSIKSAERNEWMAWNE